METTPWAELGRISRRQLGLFLYAQAAAVGVDQNDLCRKVATGLLERWHRSVYALAGTPDSWERRALAAQLVSRRRAVLSHRSAGYLHRLCDLQRPDSIELVVPRGTKVTARGARIHTSTWLPRTDRSWTEPFLVTSLERTICDLAGVVADSSLRRIVYDAWRRGRTTPQAIDSCLAPLGRVRGAARLRQVLRDAEPGLVRTRSVAEIDLYCLLRDAGFPPPKVNFELFDAGRAAVRPRPRLPRGPARDRGGQPDVPRHPARPPC